jgi:hypothetical protein
MIDIDELSSHTGKENCCVAAFIVVIPWLDPRAWPMNAEAMRKRMEQTSKSDRL